MNLVYDDESGQPMKDTLNYFYVTALIVNVTLNLYLTFFRLSVVIGLSRPIEIAIQVDRKDLHSNAFHVQSYHL